METPNRAKRLQGIGSCLLTKSSRMNPQTWILTSLRHINHPSNLVDRHPEHLPAEELRLFGPADVQSEERPAEQLVVPPEVRARGRRAAHGAVQDHRQQDQRGHAGGDQTHGAPPLQQQHRRQRGRSGFEARCCEARRTAAAQEPLRERRTPALIGMTGPGSNDSEHGTCKEEEEENTSSSSSCSVAKTT